MKTFIRLLSHLAASLLLLFVLPLPVSAQQRGTITGRIVTDDGASMSGVTVMINAYASNAAARSLKTALTDEEGNFQFTNLPQRSYLISALEGRGYVQAPRPVGSPQQIYRIGEHAVIRMTRGGVITGRASFASGEPMINAYVTAFRVRDAEGAPVRSQTYRTRSTDDRGIYRIYGLTPGIYVVSVNHGGASFYGQQSPFDGDAPTYHPSVPRDTATEIQVSAGMEVTGVDIRHRGEQGHVVSGKVVGSNESTGPATYMSNIAMLTYPGGMQMGMTAARPSDMDNGFVFLGLPDGEYDLIADQGSENGDSNNRSEPRRVIVRGADVSGIELKMLPMASINGKVVIEPSSNTCDPKTKSSIEELILNARREEKPTDSIAQAIRYQQIFVPNEKGEFKMNALAAGRYRIEPNLPSENWFVKSITSASTAGTATGAAAKTPATTSDLARAGALLKAGEKLSGVNVTITDGAASVRGKLEVKPGGKFPSRLRVHLVPAETTAAEDVLRYRELLTTDALFAFTNLAPGKYWLLAKAVADNEPSDRLPSAVAWDTAERAKLRKEAEAAKNEIELKACQRVKDHVLR